MPKEENEEK